MTKQIRFLLLSLCCSYFLYSASATAEINTKLLPLTAYSALNSKSMLTISPDGNKVAYRMTDKQKDLFVIVDITKGKMISALDIAEIQPESAYFINDEQLLFVVSKHRRISGYKGIHNVNTAFVYTITNKKLKALDNEDKEVTYVEIEDEGHHLLKANSRLQVLKAIDKFIAKHNPAN